jgi:hypothetical protein
MQIPIYTAIKVEKTSMSGGSTLPSVMSVQDEVGNLVGRYVVKVFKQTHIKQYQPTNKELYANILASEFDLEVPEPALVYVDRTIIKQLKKDNRYSNFDLREGYYFATEYLEDTSQLKVDIIYKLTDKATLENIFAFDVLIKNVDRRVGKPNVMGWQGSVLLIDHELSLDIKKTFKDYLKLNAWKRFRFGGEHRHVLIDTLQVSKQGELWNFDSFLEYLQRMNLSKLFGCRDVLERTGNNTEDFEPIISYLTEIKNNPSAFQKLLQSLIK